MQDMEKMTANPSAEASAAQKGDEKIRLRILQCGDIHLDAPVVGLSAEKSEERRRALRKTFGDLMTYVRERQIDLVLFCGDLFDNRYATNSTAEFLIREIRSCPGARFVFAPGRADRCEPGSIYTSGRLPENCYVFTEPRLTRLDFEDKIVSVYGWGFTSESLPEDLLADRRVDDPSRINLVCGYADLDGDVDSAICPVSTADLKKFGADYYAFGSRHEAGEFTKVGGAIYAYSGSLECTGFDDPGLGGADLIQARYEGGSLSIDVKKVPFASLRFHTEQIDITGSYSPSEIMQKISTLISEKKYGAQTALRIELIGDVDPAFSVLKNFESDAFGLYHFDMIDRTMPLYGTEHFHRDMSAEGEIFRLLRPKLESENENERFLAAKALRAGLAALENREID